MRKIQEVSNLLLLPLIKNSFSFSAPNSLHFFFFFIDYTFYFILSNKQFCNDIRITEEPSDLISVVFISFFKENEMGSDQ